MDRKKHVQFTIEYVRRKNDVMIPAMLSKFAIATPIKEMTPVRIKE